MEKSGIQYLLDLPEIEGMNHKFILNMNIGNISNNKKIKTIDYH